MAAKRSQHNRVDQTHGTPTARPWERRPDESAQSHRAFITYRELGPERTVGQAAAALGKSRGMLYRWSRRHQWRERAFLWDLEQQRETDAALRAARQQALERQVQDADRLQRLAMARLGKAVRRDPVSGDLELDPEVTVQDAVRVYRLGLEIERSLPAGPEAAPAEEVADDELRRMTDEELRQLIALAKLRAKSQTTEEGDDET